MRALALALLLLPACVSTSKYEAAVQDAQSAKAAAKKDHDAQLGIIGQLKRSLEDARLVGLEKEARLALENVQCKKKLEDETSLNGKLRVDLEKSGKDVDALTKAHAAEKARAELYKQLSFKFKKMIDAGDLTVAVRDGRMVLRLPNDVLFRSGKAELETAGQKTLTDVAVILRTIHRHFQVAGHTDDEPIKLSPFASNWELSTARALVVTNFLVKHGLEPEKLSAAGYGEFDPLQPNGTAAGRAKNRRIEITVQPEIDELVAVPQ
ncbi:MAG: OmpA/MotB family protein [Polyangiales bacterium]